MQSKPTKVKIGHEAVAALLAGMNAIYDPVSRTLGPEGRNALMYRTLNRGPRITNDGVTIADVIEPEDEFENLAAGAFKEAAKRTNEKAGDGTTATIVIGGKLITDIFAKLGDKNSMIRTKTAGGTSGPMAIRKEILAASEEVIAEIKKAAKKVKTIEDLERIATISVENEELGKVIAKMAWETGVDGFVDVVEGHKGEIETELIKGMRFPAKVGAKAFVNNKARYESVIEDSPVLVTNYKLDNAAQLGQVTRQFNTTKLVIFAPQFSENVLIHLVAAFKQGFHCYPIAVPALRTEQFEDLAAYTGATFINKETGKKLQNTREADLGFAARLIVKDTDAKEDAVLTGGKGDVAERLEMLKKQIVETKNELHKKDLERRIASMASAVGIIRVGGPSQAEILYLKHKIEDAVYASRGALEEGYVKGGGVCLKDIAEALPESALTAALKAPYEQIQENFGETLAIGKDVIDPAKSIRLAVEHAVSVAAHFVTVEIIIPEVRERDSYDGSKAVADAIKTFARFEALRHGLLKDSQMEEDKDYLARD